MKAKTIILGVTGTIVMLFTVWLITALVLGVACKLLTPVIHQIDQHGVKSVVDSVWYGKDKPK